MEFSSINIQGNIVSSEILIKIRNEDIKYQLSSDFLLDKKTSVRDEIGIAWAAARAHYSAFKLRVDRLKDGDSGVSETRNSWMLPLLREFGYDVEKAQAYIHPETQKSYAISHQASNLTAFPIHIMGIHDDLDRRRENSGPRLSPHGLTQEYLNNTEYTYAIVTNGKYLRLLRDATRLVRLSYLEFDLGKMMEEELYADFAVLFRLMHATRMPKSNDHLEESYIEYYHQESLASGSRIREKLSEAVETSIKTLANGFLSHPANTELIQRVQSGSIPAADFYLYQLRLIYRFLFLIVTEERNLVYPDTKDEQVQRKRKIYYDFYSIERLRKMAARLHYIDGRKNDLWEGLKSTFTIYEKGFYGEKLAIKPLGSGLFAANALGVLPVLKLGNEDLLKVIRCLTLFENDNKQWSRVNYSDLDVEEFGSVYEGLLEYDATFVDINGSPRFAFVEGKDRASSGSHYTPEELVKPLIKNSLEYLIADKIKEANPEKALLSITVCDVACGSGHILLSAARRIAFDLACIRETKANGGKDKVEQPSPKYLRAAIRDVIKNCIYGVDKNPLAVELCKVALWLEAHNPGEPLNFLDHHIKCGDAIVGLAHKEDLSNGIPDEAFKAISEDEKEVNYEVEDKKGNRKLSTLAAAFAKRNKAERDSRTQTTFDFDGTIGVNLENVFEEFTHFEELPESTPDEIEIKEKAYNKLVNSGALQRLKTLCDILVGQFFIPKTLDNKDKLVTDANYFRYLKGEKPIPQTVLAETILLSSKRFFHWFLEFPKIFKRGGFSCILGNPPFLGGLRISKNYGQDYTNYLHFNYPSCKATCDLVAYFFNRNYSIRHNGAFLSLISTNTISQGDTREGGLENIIGQNGIINFAIKSQPWPGKAAVEVSLISITDTSNIDIKRFIRSKEVSNITSFLDENVTETNPYQLAANIGISYKGSYPLGQGFIIDESAAKTLISVDPKNANIIFPFLVGDDVNSDSFQKPSRWIINFKDFKIDEAELYTEAFSIVKEKVKPEREKNTFSKSAKEKWWLFERYRGELYEKVQALEFVIVASTVTKHLAFSVFPSTYVYDVGTNVFVLGMAEFAILSSNIHEVWTRKYGSTLETRLRYTNEDCVGTFPFPKIIDEVESSNLQAISNQFVSARTNLMILLNLGLTKTYNLIHSKNITVEEIQKISKQPESISSKALSSILELREFIKKIDVSVLEVYDWPDVDLKHDFYEVEYLPETDNVRFTLHPDSRKEILKRLLDMNHKIYEEEITHGLHSKEAVEAFYKNKGIPIPTEVLALLDKNKKEKAATAKKKKITTTNKESVYVQPGLFEMPNLFNQDNDMKEFSLHEGIYSVKDAAEITRMSAAKIKRWFEELYKENYEGIDTQRQADVANFRISFHGLIELVIIGTLRDAGASLKKILTARKDLGTKTNTVYPFASNDASKLHLSGRDIVFDFHQDVIVTLDGKSQINLGFITEFFKDIVFELGIAQRISFAKYNHKIVIDPKVGGGKPSIKDKSVWVELINSFYSGTESIPMIKEQYNLEEDEVLAAVEFTK